MNELIEMIHQMHALELEFLAASAALVVLADKNAITQDEAWERIAGLSRQRVEGWNELEEDYPQAFTARTPRTQ